MSTSRRNPAKVALGAGQTTYIWLVRKTVWVSWLGVIVLLGCSRDPQKACNPPCANGAVCAQGVCQCRVPFEGPDCSADGREKFVGTWEGRRDCEGVRGGLRYIVWKDSLRASVWIAGPFWREPIDTLEGQMIETARLRIPYSVLRDTALSVEGTAEQRRDSLLMSLQVQGSARPITCVWQLKRR